MVVWLTNEVSACRGLAVEWLTRAVESASGMGYLLAQQLVAAGETVHDVPATLASRVRVLGHRPVEQDGSQRCPFGRCRRVARTDADGRSPC